MASMYCLARYGQLWGNWFVLACKSKKTGYTSAVTCLMSVAVQVDANTGAAVFRPEQHDETTDGVIGMFC